MPTPVSLPSRSWGSPSSPRHALLVHGLGSNGALMWRFGVSLADAGWHAVAVDLRGHGLAPRTLDYTIAAYAADLAATRPRRDDVSGIATAGSPWDLVIGHSLGGAASVVAAAENLAWARRLVLIDPGIHLSQENREATRLGQRAALDDPTAAAFRAENPHWHDQDIELKVISAQQATPWAIDQTCVQNTPWDVREAAARLTVPTHVIAADPGVYSIFEGEGAAEVLRNPAFTISVVEGAGHSPHRDKPEETIRQLFDAIG